MYNIQLTSDELTPANKCTLYMINLMTLLLVDPNFKRGNREGQGLHYIISNMTFLHPR